MKMNPAIPSFETKKSEKRELFGLPNTHQLQKWIRRLRLCLWQSSNPRMKKYIGTTPERGENHLNGQVCLKFGVSNILYVKRGSTTPSMRKT